MAAVKQASNWLLGTGIVLVLGGIAALAAPSVAGGASMIILGSIMLVSGIVEFLQYFMSDDEGHSGSLVGGVLTGFVGFVIIRNPAITGDGMLVLLGWFFMGGGLIRVASAIKNHHPGWGWALGGGVLDFGLGVLLWNSVVQGSPSMIGIFIGIALIFRGVPKIVAAMGLKKLQAA